MALSDKQLAANTGINDAITVTFKNITCNRLRKSPNKRASGKGMGIAARPAKADSSSS